MAKLKPSSDFSSPIFQSGILVVIALLVMFLPTFGRLWSYGWENAGYDHAVFILPISLALIWLKRDQLSFVLKAPAIGYGVLLGGIFLYLFSALNSFLFLEAISFVLVVWGIVLIRYGVEGFKKLLFPLIYLFFIVPPPGMLIDAITLPLKNLSTQLAYLILKITPLPVKRSGVMLDVSGCLLFVSDACSGFRTLASLLPLAAVYAYLQPISLKKKWFLVVMIVPFGIIANALRIFGIGLIANFWGPEAAAGVSHDITGLVVVVLAGSMMVLTNELIFLKGVRKTA